jgi:hypothetical protein
MKNGNDISPKNVIQITGPFSGAIMDTYDVINVDTTLGEVTLFLQNIQSNGLLYASRCVYINDVGAGFSLNNLTLSASLGNIVNNQASIVVNTDGANIKCNVANQNEWAASGLGIGGASAIAGANNGLLVAPGGIIQLGGLLLQPTVIDALGSNTFAINDVSGLFLKTRDALGNFFMNNIGGTGTLVGSNQYIFSYLGDGGNVFEDSLIVINFGGANNFTNATDFWNFGDYSQVDNSSSIFNFGRFNHFTNSSSLFNFGYSNELLNVTSTSFLGNYNTFSNVQSSYITGESNFSSDSSFVNLLGVGNTITNSSGLLLAGVNNVIDQLGNCGIYGNGNNISSTSDLIVLGTYNTASGASFNQSVLIGINSTGIKVSATGVDFLFFGNTPLLRVDLSNNAIVMDLPGTPAGLPANSLWRSGNDVKIV